MTDSSARDQHSRTGDPAGPDCAGALAEEQVRAWLAAAAAPPSRLAADQLLILARGRIRRRRAAVAGTAAAALAALVAVPSWSGGWLVATDDPVEGPPAASAAPSPTAPPGPLECRVTVLAPPAGLVERGVVNPAAAVAVAADPTGRYIVGNTYGGADNSPAAVRWDEAEPIAIPVEAHHVSAAAVNSRGEVVGTAVRSAVDSNDFGWVYRDGEVAELALPEGYLRVILEMDINEAGDVVGNVQDRDFKTVPVVWLASSPEQPRILPTPPESSVSAVAITDDGRVVGWFAGSSGGYWWDPDGVGQELPLPAGAHDGAIAAARGDWAVGYASFPATESQLAARIPADHQDPDQFAEGLAEATLPAPVRWDLRTGTSAALPGYRDNGRVLLNGLGFGARALNQGGDAVVGYPNPQVLRTDGREVVLAVPGEDAAADPVAISDDGGTVVGNLVADAWADPPGWGSDTGESAGRSELPRPVRWQC